MSNNNLLCHSSAFCFNNNKACNSIYFTKNFA